ncbi:MAG: SMC-Scp complex subunit ScpB [Candidatus Thermoplasmatota archaeon]|nr:SMC-Scp complex subunit ScpB [Candidatus Thermoplasmatota archaeon]MCL5888926.1 SMC-Scp complex subunit ScpB [Candidatus Thermoplasmatota archaeon]
MDIQKKIEAILFAAEEPVGLTELSSILLEDQSVVKKELRKLIKEYSERDTSITISTLGKKYRMILKSDYSEIVKNVSKPELTNEQIRLLTLILNKGKTMKGEVREKFRVQSDFLIHSLKKEGFIKSLKYRNTEIYQLTGKFYKYFNIEKGKLPVNKSEETGSEVIE